MELSGLLAWLAVALQFLAAGAFVIYPDEKWIGWLCAVIGIAIAVGALTLFLWANYPDRVADLRRGWIVFPLGLSFGLLVACLCFGLYPILNATTETPHSISTTLRLQFFGGKIIPEQIQIDNIRTWYALYNPSVEIKTVDAQGRLLGVAASGTVWNIFIVFAKPIKYQQLVASFSSPGFPPCEFKQQTTMSVILVVEGEIPVGTLQVYAKL